MIRGRGWQFRVKTHTDLTQVFGNKTLIRTQGKIDGDIGDIITTALNVNEKEGSNECPLQPSVETNQDTAVTF